MCLDSCPSLCFTKFVSWDRTWAARRHKLKKMALVDISVLQRRHLKVSPVDVKCKCISILNSWKKFHSKGRNYKVCKRLVGLRGKSLFVAPSEWQKILQLITSDDPNLKYDLFAHCFLDKFHIYMHCTCISLLLWGDNQSKFLGLAVFDCLAWSNYLM